MAQPNNIQARDTISVAYYAGKVLFSVLRWFFLISVGFIIVYPLLYMLSMSIRTPADYYDVTVVWIPKHFTMMHYELIVGKVGLWKPMLNSIIIAFGSTVGQLFIGALTGYGFARFNFKGNGLLFIFVIITIMMPTQMIQIPSYLIMMDFDLFGVLRAILGHETGIRLTDSFAAFLIPAFLGQGMRAGLFILIFRMFFITMPVELEEAARIDGCGCFKTYIRVMLPNAKTPLFICGMFSIVWYWADYFGAFSYIYSDSLKPLSVHLYNINDLLNKYLESAQQNNSYKMPAWNAALLFGLLPLLIVFVFAQNSFKQGLERSGIVG